MFTYLLFAQDVRNLDKEARVWDVYSGLDLYVKNLFTSLWAISQLQNRAVRERHWAQLIQITQVQRYTLNTLRFLLGRSLSLHYKSNGFYTDGLHCD